MRIVQVTMLALLGVSVLANIVLGTRLYDRSKVTIMDYLVYKSFTTSLNDATHAVDKASQDTGELKTQDVLQTNMNIERAVGILMGLRSEGEKRGLDFGPLMFALLKCELPSPQNPSFSSKENDFIQQTKNTLHNIQSGLQGTMYQNGEELTKLKAAVNSLNSKLSSH